MTPFVTGRRTPGWGCEPPSWRNAGHIQACYVVLTLSNSGWTMIWAPRLIGTTCVWEVALDCLAPLLSPGPLSRSGHGWMEWSPEPLTRVPPPGVHARARPREPRCARPDL